LVLGEATARYVARVHRLGPGDRFVAFDPEARSEADATVVSVGRSVRCEVGAVRASSSVAATGLTLLQAVGKGDKPEQVIRDATALGADRVVLVATNRSVVRLDAERAETRRQRWRGVAVEAARQCGRGDLPTIDGPCSLEEALSATARDAFRFHLSPDASQTLAAALDARRPGDAVAVLIGPEGGFDPVEESAAAAAGFVPVRLGDFVLRTETAAVAALAVIVAQGGSR
jgi:16S rRNA (uracil1498-N3)-methyltransferase